MLRTEDPINIPNSTKSLYVARIIMWWIHTIYQSGLVHLQAHDFLNHGGGEAVNDDAGEGRVRFEESFLALTDQTLILFNCDDRKILNYKKKDLSKLAEVKLRTDKKQCILVSDKFCFG